jgi:hypothetical protein
MQESPRNQAKNAGICKLKHSFVLLAFARSYSEAFGWTREFRIFGLAPRKK